MMNSAQESTLLRLVHDAIAYGVNNGHEMPHEEVLKYLQGDQAELLVPGASFVTLNLNGELRGCIGTLVPYQPLLFDVAHNAYNAAFSDSRFTPVTEQELQDLEIHISILNPAEEMSFSSEEDLITQLRPHVDGLIISEGGARATFLPSVWEMLPEPHDFLRHLKLKAGLPGHYWSEKMKVKRYTTTSLPHSDP